jgi:S-adenosylmethionine-diacylgycerolhomoserine-N-methlytransferase
MIPVMDALPAAEAMDGIYRRQRHIYDLTRRYYLFGRDRLIGELDLSDGGVVLEIGCGTARNLIKAARRYPLAWFFGLDVSEAMLETARGSIARHGLDWRIGVQAADACAFDASATFGVRDFDCLFISYALSMIPGWERVIHSAARCLAPRGTLHIVDFGDFSAYPSTMQRMQRAWLRRFSVVPIPDFEVRLKALGDELGLRVTTNSLYGGYAILARLEHAS